MALPTGAAPPLLVQGALLGATLQPETSGDRAFTTKLYASTRREELAAVPWSEDHKAAFLASQHDAQHQHYRLHYDGAGLFIIMLAGTPVGRLYFIRWVREIRIIDIAIVEEARGKGIGSALLRDMIDEAQASGKALSIHVERMNPALSLYRRLGFEEVEDKGVYLFLERRPDKGSKA